MKNHKISYIIFVILIALIMACTSCEFVHKSDTNEITTNEGSEAPESTLVANDSEEIVNEPPITITFDSSMDQIEMFLQAAYGAEDEYNLFCEQNRVYYSIDQMQAREIADKISAWEYPFIIDMKKCEGFGATYYVSNTPQVLDIIYKIDGVRYRFSYSYNYVNKHEYEGETAVDTILIGDYIVPMYKREGYFVGSYIEGTLQVSVKVFTDDWTDIDLNSFEYSKFGS